MGQKLYAIMSTKAKCNDARKYQFKKERGKNNLSQTSLHDHKLTGYGRMEVKNECIREFRAESRISLF